MLGRNSGTADMPFWQSLGLRFTAKGMGDMRGVRFEDINGDVSVSIRGVEKVC